MTEQRESVSRLLWMLGLALTLPVILLSGPLAGFLIALVVTKQFGLPDYWVPVLCMTGLAGSGIQVYQIIRKLYRAQKKK